MTITDGDEFVEVARMPGRRWCLVQATSEEFAMLVRMRGEAILDHLGHR